MNAPIRGMQFSIFAVRDSGHNALRCLVYNHKWGARCYSGTSEAYGKDRHHRPPFSCRHSSAQVDEEAILDLSSGRIAP
jgi:hypothetical protein